MVGGGRPTLIERLKSVLKDTAASLETYKLLKYEALRLRFRPKPVGDYLKTPGDPKGSDPVDYDSLEAWTRVSPHDFESNIREMARLAMEKGAMVVLLDNELWDGSPYRPVLRRISKELGVPLVDSLRIVGDARAKIERDLEAELGLAASSAAAIAPALPPADRTRVVFRVFRGSAVVPKTLSIVGADPQLGSRVPNTIAMRDDGTGGDQKAADGVWNYTASLPSGRTVSYVYTNSGAVGQWEGLDLPHVRSVEVPSNTGDSPVYLPIDTFGRVYMQGDDWHTDKVGYDLIGHAVAREIAALR